MTGTNTKLTAAVETYFADLGRVRASGGTSALFRSGFRLSRNSRLPVIRVSSSTGRSETVRPSRQFFSQGRGPLGAGLLSS